jgi:AcrR family transcriptional regulator
MPKPARTKKASKTQSAAAATARVFREDVRAFKQEMIIDTAIDVFYRIGYQAATVDDIAAGMSATKALIYYYFDTKEAVLQAIITRCSALTLGTVERGINAGSTPAEKLALGIHCYAENILANHKMIGVYFREEHNFSPTLHNRATQSEKTITSRLSEVIAAGIKANIFRESDPQLLALNLTGMVTMAFYWYREHGRLSEAELCRHFASEALYIAGYQGEVALDQWLKKLA